MRIRTLLAALGLAGLISLASAQNPASQNSGVPTIPSTFRLFMVNDSRFPAVKNAEGKDERNPKDRTDKIHCLVCEYGLNPVVAIFVRSDVKSLGPDSGVARLVKALDAQIAKNRGDKLSGFVAFLKLAGGTKVVTLKKVKDGVETEEKVEQDMEYPDDEKRDEHKVAIQNFASALMAANVPFGLGADKSKAISAWGVKDTDEVTVVVYNRMRIVGKPWAFTKADDLTDEKIAEILKSAEAAIASQP